MLIKEKFVDLHMHSTFSDGRFTPSELVEKCGRLGFAAMALTDHDSCLGVAEACLAAKKYPGLQVIAGVELDTRCEGQDVHILGYYIDTENEALRQRMDGLRLARERRLQLTVARLRELGYAVEVTDCDPVNKAVGRPHVAKALVEKGYVATVQEAFDKLLGEGCPAYVQLEKLTPAEAAALIHQAGGLAVLAHPGEIADASLPERLLAEVPFDGIEVWHPSNRETLGKWLALAEKYKLLKSGGSDFHGIPAKFPEHLGVWRVRCEDVIELLNIKKR